MRSRLAHGSIEGMTQVPEITLNDGHSIPQVGFGVFQIQPDETAAAVSSALEAGYRHIDTAQMYGNEAGVGDGVTASGVDRADVYITSKLNNSFHRPDDARRSFDKTLEDLGSDYVDLFLIHWPLPTLYDGDFVSTWRALEEFAADGRARSIGVSNFQIPHLRRLLEETGTAPAVNQIEAHPYFGNNEVRAFCREQGIAVEAWAPIAQGKAVTDPKIMAVAERLGHTAAQVTLRWHIQLGNIVFPKSVSPQRIRENLALFDFTLDDDAMLQMADLDQGAAGRFGPDPDTFDMVP